MKFIHLSDLHLGKSVLKRYFFEEQYEQLQSVVQYVLTHNIDAVLISGDIYDTKNPKKEAIALYSWFVNEVTQYVPLLAIAGNHDLAEIHDFASELLQKNKYYVAGQFQFPLPKVTFKGEEIVNIYLFPYVTVEDLNDYFYGKCSFETIQEGVSYVLEHTILNHNERNILLFHGFVTGRHDLLFTESERTTTLGTAQAIDYHIFSDFDYVALGHLHRYQRVETSNSYYSGSLYWYSDMESTHDKGMIELTITPDNMDVSFVPLEPTRRFIKAKGTLYELLNHEPTDDYVVVELTEDIEDSNIKEMLKPIFPNILRIIQPDVYENQIEDDELFNFNTDLEQQIKQYYTQRYQEEMDDTMEKMLQQVFKEMEEI